MVKPYISKNNVRLALNNMLLGMSTTEPDGLYDLAVVDMFLSDPDLPEADNLRHYAVNVILSDLIEDSLSTSRRSYGLKLPERSTTRDEACQQFTLDAQQRSSDLLGWSLLYYRYVRVDLNITPAEASSLSHVEDRTLRRYQSSAIDRLRDALVAAEWSARQGLRRSRHYAMIPAVIPSRLYGREQILLEATGPDAPRHMLITGASGIGKTSLVGKILYEHIANDAIEHLVWIDAPESVHYVRHFFFFFLVGDSTFSLKQWSLLYKLAVVLDNITALLNKLPALQELLVDLAGARVYLTNQFYADVSQDLAHIALAGIDREASALLIQDLRGQHGESNLRAFASAMHDRVGGNPRIIKLAANRVVNLDIDTPLIDEETLRSLFHETFQALTEQSKILLQMFAILPAARLNRAEIGEIWPDLRLGDGPLLDLLSRSLLDKNIDSEMFTANSAVRAQIQTLYYRDDVIRHQIDYLVEEINVKSAASLAFVEHLLSGGWPEISRARRHHFLETYASRGLKAAHYAVWSSLLFEPEVAFDLQIIRAICLRSLAEYTAAGSVLEKVIEGTGQVGDFTCQARALVELSVVCRHQGRYDEALWRLSQASSTHDQTTINRIRTEEAQIAVDQGDMAQAYAILQDQPRSLQNLQLLGEITAATGSLAQSQRFIDMALLQTQYPREIGRLKAARARVQAQQQDYGKAEESFAAAMILLDQEHDAFALARCQTNLAAMLIQTKEDLTYAEQLLAQAQQQQTVMQDRVGLMFTQHNLQALDQILAIDDGEDQSTMGPMRS